MVPVRTESARCRPSGSCSRVIAASARRIAWATAWRARSWSSDARRFLVVQVRLSSEKRALAGGELVNISGGGVQVDLSEALPLGTPLRVAFHIPGEGSAFNLEGRVQWTRPAGLNAAGDHVHSHGIAFVDFTPWVRDQHADMLEPR